MIVLIPSYEPDYKLVDLVEMLSAAPAPHQVLIVNDGSDPRFDPVFDKVRILGATVVEHHPNRGKGYALSSGALTTSPRTTRTKTWSAPTATVNTHPRTSSR